MQSWEPKQSVGICTKVVKFQQFAHTHFSAKSEFFENVAKKAYESEYDITHISYILQHDYPADYLNHSDDIPYQSVLLITMVILLI